MQAECILRRMRREFLIEEKWGQKKRKPTFCDDKWMGRTEKRREREGTERKWKEKRDFQLSAGGAFFARKNNGGNEEGVFFL